MQTISLTSNQFKFQIKIKDNEKKYLVTISSPVYVEQDVKIKGINLQAFLKLLRIHSIRINETIATEIEDYLLNIKNPDTKSGCLTFIDEGKDKYFLVQTENGDKKYFAIKRLYDDVKDYNSQQSKN